VDRADDTKVVKSDGGKKRAALDLLATLPLSAGLETSFTSTKSPGRGTQNGSIEFRKCRYSFRARACALLALCLAAIKLFGFAFA
jgi:hypothetical protein